MASKSLPIVPTHPDEEDWDVVIVGTGMGGATAGYELAARGKKVLYLERGHYLFGDHDRTRGALLQEENPADRLNNGWWPEHMNGETNMGPVRFFGPYGCGTGGSSSVFAAQMERFHPSDFEPRKHHPQGKKSSAPEAWPFAYADFVPYYRKAEKIFHVCGTPDPLNPDPQGQWREPPKMSERDAALFEGFAKAGWHPYRAHVGCRYIPECNDCGGILCPKECKSDAGRVCLEPAVHQHGAKLLPDCEVTRLEANKESVTRVHYVRDGKPGSVRGKVVIVACGSLLTPALLLKSASDLWPNGLANSSDQVGRNLMMHTADFVAVRPAADLSDKGPAKAISLNDLYFVDGKKCGTFQSVGIAVSTGAIEAFLAQRAEKDPKWYLKVGKLGRKVAARIGGAMFSHSNIFSTMVEDLPYSDNRVVLNPSQPNGMHFLYTYSDELFERNVLFRKELDKRLKGHLKHMVLTGDNNLNFGHVSGTCRSGDDPKVNVVDKTFRAHDLSNLYVADSSWFPSSGGVNPSLTIAAGALRVADTIAGRL